VTATKGTAVLSPEDGALLDAVRTLRWPARRRAPGGLAGDHTSRVLGGAAEFTEYRAYRQGDDPARLDWKLLARSDRAYIRLSEERMVLPTTLIVDASASLAYPSATHEKWHLARQITLGLAAAAHRGSDPVGLVVATATGPIRLPPRTRRGVVHEVARVLAEIEPGGSESLVPLLQSERGRGRVVIVSDFLGTPTSGETDALLLAAAALTASGREVYAVHLVHAAELDPPRQPIVVRDPEAEGLRRPLTEATRHGYLEAFAEWRAWLAYEWRKAGAIYNEVVTTEPAVHSVRRIIMPGGDPGSGSMLGLGAGEGAGGSIPGGAR
jgi:uncharacterized protein (DUF58 family)